MVRQRQSRKWTDEPTFWAGPPKREKTFAFDKADSGGYFSRDTCGGFGT